MWMQLIELQPQTSDSGGGMSREEFIDATATDILKKIPVVYDLDKLKKKYGLEVTPTQVVLLQELERFNQLISTIHKSLSTLKKVKIFKKSSKINERGFNINFYLIGS